MRNYRNDQARVFKALADPNRLALLWQLVSCGTANCVGRIAECCPVDLSVTSRHLSVLKQAGLVTAEKKGKEVHYSINANFIVRFLRSLADSIESCCGTKSKDKTRRAK
jgi:ArsR family transcriptional regulator